MARYRRCPHCEELQFQIIEIDDQGDVQKAECWACGYTGWCAECDTPLEDPLYLEYPQHCSIRCANNAAAQREAESMMDEMRGR